LFVDGDSVPRNLQLCNPERSAVAEHLVLQGHRVYFEDTVAFAKVPHCTSIVLREAIEITLHQNFNSEDGYQLSHAWKIIHTAAERTAQI
jgi:hypothetical protein